MKTRPIEYICAAAALLLYASADFIANFLEHLLCR